MGRPLYPISGGLQLISHGNGSDGTNAVQMPLPKRIILPLKQHIGAPARPVVTVGDRVLKGQTIAEPDGKISVPVHASTSGVVTEIGNCRIAHPFSAKACCVVIEPDGKDEPYVIEAARPYQALQSDEFQQIIQDCGVVGLGGVGFPTYIKLKEGSENLVDTLIINGVECQPCISCDDWLIREQAAHVVSGIRMIRDLVQAKYCILAVGENMAEAYGALAEQLTACDSIELIRVPDRYPAGDERQLIRIVTGKEVPCGGFAIHIGIVVHNVATVAAVYRAIAWAEPMISRYLTVTGEVGKSRNLKVLLGTPISDCLRICGYEENEDNGIIIGGKMMGTHVKDSNIPVTKTTSCVIASKKNPPVPQLPCIRCGRCTQVCPVNLLPQQLYHYIRADDLDNARDHHVFDCIECGCCSYVCPSHIPLVRYYQYAKSEIAFEDRCRQDAIRAKKRFLARKGRQDKRAAGKIEQRRRYTEVNKHTDLNMAAKKAFIKAAVERRLKKKQQSNK